MWVCVGVVGWCMPCLCGVHAVRVCRSVCKPCVCVRVCAHRMCCVWGVCTRVCVYVWGGVQTVWYVCVYVGVCARL